jgi:hypothetical protein
MTRPHHWIRGFSALLFVVLLVSLAACQKAEEARAVSAVEPAVANDVRMDVAEPSAGETTDRGPITARKVIRRAALTLSSQTVRQAADEAVRIVERAEGYVASRQEQYSGDQVTQSIVSLRVPAAKFEGVLAQVKQQGSVVVESITGQDVTEEFTDTEARLRAQRVLEERLLALSTSRQDVRDLLEVEKELSRVRSEIERLSGRQQFLENQTAFATIELRIESPHKPAVAGTESVWSQLVNAVSDGLDASVVVIGGLIRVGFAMLPFLPLPLFAIVWWQVRRRRAPARESFSEARS